MKAHVLIQNNLIVELSLRAEDPEEDKLLQFIKGTRFEVTVVTEFPGGNSAQLLPI